MINVDGPRVDYTESGDGPAVLFIPGSFSTPAAWTNIQKLLPQKFRCVGTSLCGYGSTEETRSLEDLGMEHLIRNMEEVVKRLENRLI